MRLSTKLFIAFQYRCDISPASESNTTICFKKTNKKKNTFALTYLRLCFGYFFAKKRVAFVSGAWLSGTFYLDMLYDLR